ncbi:MAG: helix-turn-helix domain-containing protein [Pseudomonadota bacterium]|uniref:TetR/AcrR family transcriptional regulator n=1 Tax=Alcanivorax sp. TaxID=1872427 RepID=UPI00243C82D5|nr:TetR/AcrR family transcriptional regulator [Alcanivorax sp.]MED5240089.1 helix-turn-helix domain-containing protein [Pseudomonadota bacterium]MEE3319252.1 helix-turn-helix domain-containing protein [Pseudomonadota bacterium]
MSRNTAASNALLQGIQLPEGDKTYVKILDAGLALFIEFGLRRTTMEDVANRAGVGRATAYRRFGDKDQLIHAVILREAKRELDLIEQELNAIEGGLNKLLESFVLAVTRAHAHPLWRRLQTSDTEIILPFFTQGLWQMMAFFRMFLATMLERVKKEEAISDLSTEFLAELMLRLMQSMLLSPEGVMNPSDEASVRKVADQCLRPLMAG